MTELQTAQLLSRLNAISKLMVLNMTQGKDQAEQIRLFSLAGFAPKEIAETLGTTPNNVSVRLSALRKTSAKGRSK